MEPAHVSNQHQNFISALPIYRSTPSSCPPKNPNNRTSKETKEISSPIASKKRLLHPLRIPHPKPRRPKRPLVQSPLRIIQQLLLPLRHIRRLQNPLDVLGPEMPQQDIPQQIRFRHIHALLPHADPEFLKGRFILRRRERGFYEDHCALGLLKGERRGKGR